MWNPDWVKKLPAIFALLLQGMAYFLLGFAVVRRRDL